MLSPASRMELVPFSGIRKVFERAKALEREGRPVIFLETGRPDFDTPRHIKEAAKRALDAGDVHYTSNYGTAELRAAIAEKLRRENGLRYDPGTEILVTIGAAEAILDVFLSVLNPGDEVLYPEPSWLNYMAAARLAGAIPVPIPLRESNGYQIDVDEVRERITPRTRLLVVVSPHNPTGTVQSPDTLRRLADLANRCDLLVMSDEIYERITYDGQAHLPLASCPGMRDRTVTINGFSKAFSMTGWRLGYAAAPPPLIQAMNRVHQYNVSCACAFAQAGAVAALTGPQDCVTAMVAEFKRRRDLVVPAVNAVPGLSCLKPGGAFYVWVNISRTGVSSEEFSLKLLEGAHVSSVPGTVFGESGQGYIRFSYANAYERLEEAMRRLARFAA
ncbi:MAG TPA: pyridoxal phosphate-dependent aminotransferase [Candidatus Methylomirabilis sp.]|nr:pyridoxal phosphate-dependent aminotransferase [Candidatus Methylomirabilis sp.]